MPLAIIIIHIHDFDRYNGIYHYNERNKIKFLKVREIQDFAAVLMKISVLCDTTQCRLIDL
jgi:hypothetical protein